MEIYVAKPLTSWILLTLLTHWHLAEVGLVPTYVEGMMKQQLLKKAELEDKQDTVQILVA